MRKQQILNGVLGTPDHHNDELLYNCPKCSHHKKKLSINLTKGVFKCWVCEFAGKNLGFLIKKYGNHEQYIKWSSLSPSYKKYYTNECVQESALALPEGFITLCTPHHRIIHRSALNYLKTRGIGLAEIHKWKIGFCYGGKYQDRIVIPSFNCAGKLDYFIARSFANSKIKYLNPRASKNIVFNDLMVDWSEPVVLVEGVFDALKIENSIPLLGSTLSIESKLFQKIIEKGAEVFIALDHDAQRKEEKIIKDLLLYGTRVHKMTVPPNRDVGDLSREECKLIKQKANFVDGTDYLLYQKIFSEALK